MVMKERQRNGTNPDGFNQAAKFPPHDLTARIN